VPEGAAKGWTFVLLSAMYSRLHSFLGQFAELTDEEFEAFRKLIVTRKLAKKDFLTRAGEVERFIYFLDEGLIHQYFLKGKEEVTTDLIPAGTVANAAVSFLSGKPSQYSLQAMEPCLVFGLSKDQLDYLYSVDRKWQQLGRKLLSYYLMKQETAMVDNLRFTMRERFMHFVQQNPGLMERVPQRRLASYLNIKPETFTRLKPLLKHA
jgi:CRP-like cAMP-binding protein